MRGEFTHRLRAGALTALAFASLSASAHPGAGASGCTREDARNADRSGTAAIAAEARRILPAYATASAATPAADPGASLLGGRFTALADRASLIDRMRTSPRLRILRLWDTRKVTVYFGVDRRGFAGLHVAQQDPRDDLNTPTLAAMGFGPH